MKSLAALLFPLATLLLLSGSAAVPHAADSRVTILYDAFGKSTRMTRDWGYSALIEHGGKRILFDTGNDPAIFARNVRAAGVDLGRLDFAVISHRHRDHTGGVEYLLRANPDVRIYAPKEAFGPFGSRLPSTFYRRHDSLPEEMRYYGGHPEDTLSFGAMWAHGRFLTVDSTVEVAPGVYLIAQVSETAGTRELRELSLALRTSEGMVLVAGCSHPGIERIVEAAARMDARVHLVLGGFHLPSAADEDIERIATALHDTYRVARVAPGHCTGEPAFYHFRKTWQGRYTYAGVGSVIDLP